MSVPSEQLPPSAEDTAQQVAAIAAVHNTEATLALQSLARAVMEAVEQVDRTHNIGRFLEKIEVVVVSEGIYHLNIHDKETGVDSQQMAKQVLEGLPDAGFGKRLRPIQLEFTRGDRA